MKTRPDITENVKNQTNKQILSLLHVVMSSVIQFNESIHPMVLYENDLISIIMNVYVNLQKIGKII